MVSNSSILPIFLRHQFAFQFVDAKTGEQIGLSGGDEVSVEIEGVDKASIVDNAGSSSPTPVKGFLTLALRPDVSPSDADPVDFQLVCSAPGYLETSVRLSIREPGTNHKIVKLVNVNNTPSGSSVQQDNSLTSDGVGTALSELVITSPEVSGSAESTSASFTVPAGTTLLDENMNPVSGTISSTIVYFNNEDENALAVFPGGLTGIPIRSRFFEL